MWCFGATSETASFIFDWWKCRHLRVSAATTGHQACTSVTSVSVSGPFPSVRAFGVLVDRLDGERGTARNFINASGAYWRIALRRLRGLVIREMAEHLYKSSS